MKTKMVTSEANIIRFWDKKGGKIAPEDLISFLTEKGFGKMESKYIDKVTFIQVKENNVVEIVDNKFIRDYCFRYIESFVFDTDDERKNVKNSFYINKNYFDTDNLSLINKIELDEIYDTKEESYLFFEDGMIRITKGLVDRLNYGDIEGHVLEESIIKRRLGGDTEAPGDFESFIRDISEHDIESQEESNYNSIRSIIGYMLHRYKNQALAKAAVLYDPIRDGVVANGRTGKSLLCKALGEIRFLQQEDGKYFENEGRFRMANITYRHSILQIDDVKQGFRFSDLFPFISGDMRVEVKNGAKYGIKFERSPKLIITSNYQLKKADEGSHKDRAVNFVLSDHFDGETKPDIEYGALFFDGWVDEKEEEWDKFYWFMISCIEYYLSNGLQKQFSNNESREMQMYPVFNNFIDNEIKADIEYNTRDVLDMYNESCVFEKDRLRQKGFMRLIRVYAGGSQYDMTERHSGSIRYFKFSNDVDE